MIHYRNRVSGGINDCEVGYCKYLYGCNQFVKLTDVVCLSPRRIATGRIVLLANFPKQRKEIIGKDQRTMVLKGETLLHDQFGSDFLIRCEYVFPSCFGPDLVIPRIISSVICHQGAL